MKQVESCSFKADAEAARLASVEGAGEAGRWQMSGGVTRNVRGYVESPFLSSVHIAGRNLAMYGAPGLLGGARRSKGGEEP